MSYGLFNHLIVSSKMSFVLATIFSCRTSFLSTKMEDFFPKFLVTDVKVKCVIFTSYGHCQSFRISQAVKTRKAQTFHPRIDIKLNQNTKNNYIAIKKKKSF